jgi:hypothetical protein
MWSLHDGNVFVGEWENNLKKAGIWYELQEDDTYKEFNVTYNFNEEESDFDK